MKGDFQNKINNPPARGYIRKSNHNEEMAVETIKADPSIMK